MAPEDGDNRDGVAVQCRLVKRRLADGSERVQVEDPVCEPLWTLNNWWECQADRSRPREIRVIPVSATLEALQARLDSSRGAGPGGGDPQGEILLRTLQVRRERARECLGGSLVPGRSSLGK
jgi:hypothetical protein